ncbi:MAG TPA: lipocalin family protein [Gemmatimonadaceae bacterium]|nr:lipocalin family protein [Gemmatimonadaceae bacterium]
MKRILMLAFAAALTMGASACQDTTSPGAVLSGTYTLQSINNVPPPVVIYQDPTVTREAIGGQIQINRDGTFTDVVTYRDTPAGGYPGAPYNDTIYGTWSLSGNTLQFNDANNVNNTYYATVSGSELVFVNYASGTSYTTVYSK